MDEWFEKIKEHLPYLGWEIKEEDSAELSIYAYNHLANESIHISQAMNGFELFTTYNINEEGKEKINELYQIVNKLNVECNMVKWFVVTHDDGDMTLVSQLRHPFSYDKANFAYLISGWERDIKEAYALSDEIDPFLGNDSETAEEAAPQAKDTPKPTATDIDTHLDKLNALTKNTLQ